MRLLNLRESEWRFALALLVVLAINSVVLELADVVATAGFVSSLGADMVPWLWIADMVVALLVASVFAKAIDRAPRLQVLSWLIGALAAVYLVTLIMFEAGLPDWITYPLLYIVSDQQFMMLPLVFWSLVNDVYTMSEAKRLIPIIAAGTALGSVIGNSLPALTALIIAPDDAGYLIVLAVLLLLASLGLLQFTFRARVVRARSAKPDTTGLVDNLRVGADFFMNLPLFRYLAISMLLVGLALTIIEFNLLSLLEQSFATSLAFQAFYGLYKAALITCLVIFQALITGRLLQRVAMRNGYLALPSALLIASGLALLAPGLAGAAGGRFSPASSNAPLMSCCAKPLRLALVPDERRGRISVFLDSYFFTAATLAGSVLLLLIFQLRGGLPVSAQITALAVAALAAAGAVWASLRARSAYGASLLNWRLARSRRKSVLDGIDF